VINPLVASADSRATNDLSAAIAQNRAWLTALEAEDSSAVRDDRLPNALPALAIDGAGLLVVLDERGRRAFSRTGAFHVADDGRLLDDRNRQVMGFAAGSLGVAPSALRVPSADIRSNRYHGYEIDEDGTLYGMQRSASSHRKAVADVRVKIGTLCIAVFPAPDLLASDQGEQLETRASGPPSYVPAGAAHVGALRRRPQHSMPEALRENLRDLWSLSGRADIEVAMAAGADALARIALNLVK
jgi:hypothetical protein